MRIKLRHQVRFSFADPARSLTHVLRLTPRSHEGQRINNWRIDVSPDCLLKSGEDHFGNLTHTLTIPGLVSELAIIVQGEISNYDAVGIVRGSAERMPLDIYLRTTPFTAPDPAVRAFADEIGAQPADRIGQLHNLMGAVHQRLGDSDAGATAIGAATTLAAGQGGPEDHAHLFIASARHLGWPSRCVTGYLVPEEGEPRRHTWAEVHVDGLGWIGFDAVNDLCPQESHIRTAVGLDAMDAAAIRGIRLDGLTEGVEVKWLLGRDPPPGGDQRQSQRQD